MAKAVKFIAAIDDKRGLAKEGRIPWDLPTDRKFFRDSISSSPGIMGFNTFAANRYKPFPTCPRNFIVTESQINFPGVETINNLEKFMQEFDEDLWVIGGGDIFSQLLSHATHLYITRVSGDFDCDVIFPEFEGRFELASQKSPLLENGIEFQYQLWKPKSG